VQVHALLADGEPLERISRLRAELDADRAARYPLHVTVAYQPARPLAALGAIRGAKLLLGSVRVWPAPEVGIYLDVEDPSGWLAAIRRAIEVPSARPYVPHVTLLHHERAAHITNLSEVCERFARAWEPTECLADSLVGYDDTGKQVERLELR
jgi:2'-5' RNA ligase